MELYFIRHGQSENNANLELDGAQDVPDPELTETGRAQAARLSRFLRDSQARRPDTQKNTQNQNGFGLTHIYTSLMVRAVNTAMPAAKALGLPLVAWPEIHETGGIFSREDGDEMKGLPGKTRSYFQTHYPDLILPDWVDESGWWNRPFEASEVRQQRAGRVWADLLDYHGDRPGRDEHRVALVSHGGFFMHLFTSALGIEMPTRQSTWHEYWFLMNNCAISRLDIKNGQVLISYVNRNDFMPGDLIT